MSKVLCNTVNFDRNKTINTEMRPDRPENMYFKMILVFSGALCIYAQRNHELCVIYGCFESSETRFTVQLDGDEVCYADYEKGRVIWDSKIPTDVRPSNVYEYALHFQADCLINMNRWKPDKSVAKITEAPEVIIYPRDEVIEEEENTLICYIHNFFPPSINIKWTKNDIEVKVDDPLRRYLSNHDGTFYVFSYLNFVPKEGDIYSCTVEHESLEEPQTKFWVVDIDELDIGPSVFCGLGLGLGLLGFTAGVFFFNKGNHYQDIMILSH